MDMTTFQALIYGIIQGFSEFLPIGAKAHRLLVPYFIGWPEPTGDLLGALYLGSFLAVLIYFAHDWASLLSSFIQVIIYRRRPMTLDERLPFFLIAASLPVTLVWHYAFEEVYGLDWSPLVIAGVLAATGLLLAFTDSFSRRSKAMYDWNWLDSLVVGIAQIGMLIPGADRTASALIGGGLRNYSREASAKFAFLCATPFLFGKAALHVRDALTLGIGTDASWLTLVVAAVVSFFCGFLAIGGLMSQLQSRKGFGGYVMYRLLLAAAVVAVWWLKRDLEKGSGL
jgi:undecaprenyl-diphosphatase